MYIGTTNSDKIAEIASLLQPLGISLKPVSLDVPEIYETFTENSILKAVEYAKHVKGICLSEDSGLEVKALGGQPGPYSARYCFTKGFDKTLPTPTRQVIDDMNNNLVLENMKGITDRSARFVVFLTVAAPDGSVLFQSNAYYEGYISDEKKGTNGFGYDSIFIGQDTFGRTLAELDPVRKNMKSHRKMVLDELYNWAANNIEILK